jgi:diamine N-acetyltransferase
MGFLMLEIDPDDEEDRPYWLWRLMVAASHQRRGIATAALALAFEEVRARGGGFEPTGEVDDGEIVARLHHPEDRDVASDA